MGWIKQYAERMLGCMDRMAAHLSNIEQALVMIWDELKFIDGTHPKILKAEFEKKYEHDTPEKTPRKRYRGTYTDEQSISSKLGRRIKRGELKEAAKALGVQYIQDETNHHVYVRNTCLDIVLNHLKNAKEE